MTWIARCLRTFHERISMAHITLRVYIYSYHDYLISAILLYISDSINFTIVSVNSHLQCTITLYVICFFYVSLPASLTFSVFSVLKNHPVLLYHRPIRLNRTLGYVSRFIVNCFPLIRHTGTTFLCKDGRKAMRFFRIIFFFLSLSRASFA